MTARPGRAVLSTAILFMAALVPTVALRTDARGQEASLKYFFLSLVASAIFLYALVCLYGIGGSTDLLAIAARLQAEAATSTIARIAEARR